MGDVAVQNEAAGPFNLNLCNPAPANADVNVIPMPLNEPPSSMIDLPDESRIQIWNFLSPTEHKMLRLVCKKFKQDVEHTVGVHATLSGGQPFNEMVLMDKLRVILGIGTHHEDLKKNSSWLESVLVRSLTVRQLARMTDHGYSAPKIQNRNLLKTLKIELDKDKAPPLPVIFMIRTYNYMTSLTLTGITSDLSKEDAQPINNFSKILLCSLSRHDELKEMTFRVQPQFEPDSRLRDSYAHKIIGALECSDRFDDPDGPKLDVRRFGGYLPTWLHKLKKLDLYLITLRKKHLEFWKRFLDHQDQLTDLMLNLGLVHWQFYRTVLSRNSATLRHLDLVMINWFRDNVVPLNNRIPETEWFNWNLLNHMTQLTSLRISMVRTHTPFLPNKIPEAERGVAFDTVNFQNLQLNNLEKLELGCVYFRPCDLDRIFGEFPNLKDVVLAFWTRTGETSAQNSEDYTGRNIHLVNLLNTVLPQRRFTRIKLTDPSLASAVQDVEQNVFPPAQLIPHTLFRGLVRPCFVEMNIIKY